MKALIVVRAVVFVLLAFYLLIRMPWTYLPLLVANVDTQAILSRTELRHVMGPLVATAAIAVAWIGVDAYLGLRLWRRERRLAQGSPPPAPGGAERK